MVRWDGQGGCARARRGACGAGRQGYGGGAPWAGLDGHKPVQPARRSTAPGSSPARSSSAARCKPGASQLPSERATRRRMSRIHLCYHKAFYKIVG